MVIHRKHIDQVFSQKFTLLDQKMLVKYFADKNLNEETKVIIKEQWEQFVPDADNIPDLEHAFYKLSYAIDNRKGFTFANRRGVYLNFYQIAAIFIVGLFLTASILTFDHIRNVKKDQQVEFISQTGFRNQFRLPDGTTGWLGSGSELKYSVDDHDQRIVDLNGLAFFNVSHKEKQPFIVTTPVGLTIQVRGTKFNVSAYAGDITCEVVLEQGSVKLNPPGRRDAVNLISNERAVYHPKNHTIEKSKVDVADYLAWKDGKLILNEIPLKEACLKLGRFYHIEFDLQTKNLDKHQVRLVLENETLEDALNLLTLISPVKCLIEDRKMLNSNRYSKKKVIIKNK